jgi:hypothetical protein
MHRLRYCFYRLDAEAADVVDARQIEDEPMTCELGRQNRFAKISRAGEAQPAGGAPPDPIAFD